MPKMTRGSTNAMAERLSQSRELNNILGGQSVYDFLLESNSAEGSKRKRTQVARYSCSDIGPCKIVAFEINGIPRKGLYPGGNHIKKVFIHYCGSRTEDFEAADRAAGYAAGSRPAGYVWHHFHDYNLLTNQGTMYLMKESDHNVNHYGGVAQYKYIHSGDPIRGLHYV